MTALEHITVVDLTRLLPGAAATQMLAAFGARVIKIEQPGLGDYARHGFGTKGVNPLFLETNRNKQSIAIDLKLDKGKKILRDLAERADILVEGFRPGVMDRLGLGYSALAAINPRLIYVALTGYGQTGEYSQIAGHDLNYLAMAGVLNEIGSTDAPAMANVQFADIAGGSHQVVMGALIALEARHRTGLGQFVDVSMMDGVTSLLPVPYSMHKNGQAPERGNELLSGRYACYNIYRTSDDRWITVGALEQKFWAALCSELECPELIAEQFAPEPRQSEIKSKLASIFVTHTAHDWFERLRDKDCCVAPVRTIEEVHNDPHFATHPIGAGPKLSATPAAYQSKPPALGEHTRAVLDELGYTGAQVADFMQAGVIE